MAIIPYENIRKALEMKRRKKSSLLEVRSSVIGLLLPRIINVLTFELKS